VQLALAVVGVTAIGFAALTLFMLANTRGVTGPCPAFAPAFSCGGGRVATGCLKMPKTSAFVSRFAPSRASSAALVKPPTARYNAARSATVAGRRPSIAQHRRVATALVGRRAGGSFAQGRE